jgi:hypothetical protein
VHQSERGFGAETDDISGIWRMQKLQSSASRTKPVNLRFGRVEIASDRRGFVDCSTKAVVDETVRRAAGI